jgi:hypothetical protein
VRPLRVWKKLLGLRRTAVEQVDFEETDGTLVVSVRPRARERDRCPECRRRCPGYDQGADGGGRPISPPACVSLRPTPTGQLPPSRGGRRGGAMGAPRRRVHQKLRGSDGVAGGAH